MEKPNITFIHDGQVHRFHVKGDKSGSKNGWYIAKPNGWIVYSSWKEGDSRYYINKDGSLLNDLDLKQFRKDLAVERSLMRLKQEIAAKDLKAIVNNCTLSKHPYLAKKGFPDLVGYVQNNTLVIPICDMSRNFSKIISLQYIYGDGSKRFAKGCRTKGGLHIISPEIEPTKNIIYLCEGYATGLTISLATNSIVAVCFYATNIIHTAELLKTRFPENKVVICADNDRNTDGNPGVTEAIKASKKLLMPMLIPDLSKCSSKASDYNDIMNECSIAEVELQLKRVLPCQ